MEWFPFQIPGYRSQEISLSDLRQASVDGKEVAFSSFHSEYLFNYLLNPTCAKHWARAGLKRQWFALRQENHAEKEEPIVMDI